VAEHLGTDEMLVLDAGFKHQALIQADLPRFVVRLAKNFTARRIYLPAYEFDRPDEYGEIVRPLARTYDGKLIPATPPDRVETWKQCWLQLRAECWDDLVCPACKHAAENQAFSVVAIYDPRLENPGC
jgi:hypothetical protein